MLGRLLKLYVAGPEHPAKFRCVRWIGRHLMPRKGLPGCAYPGKRLWLNPVDWVEYLILRYGRYEPLTLDFLGANLSAGDQAILAGVNNGLHAIVAADAVGATGRVIGCDPQPSALLRARANLELNPSATALELVAAALGRSVDLVRMPWPSPDNPGAASFFAEGPGFVAPVLTLAQLAQTLRIDRLRLLLLDVQGYEDQALAGLGDSLRPEIAIVEDTVEMSEQAGITRESVFDLLRNMGYSLFDLYGTPVDAPAAELPERNLVALLPNVVVRWSQQS